MRQKDDEDDVRAFISAAKGEPYTAEEWDAEVQRLHAALEDAIVRRQRAQEHGCCLAARFDA